MPFDPVSLVGPRCRVEDARRPSTCVLFETDIGLLRIVMPQNVGWHSAGGKLSLLRFPARGSLATIPMTLVVETQRHPCFLGSRTAPDGSTVKLRLGEIRQKSRQRKWLVRGCGLVGLTVVTTALVRHFSRNRRQRPSKV